MDLNYTDEDIAFRQEVRTFLQDALTPELIRAGKLTTSVFSDFEASIKWQKILHKKGWAAPEWPEQYGGTGWTLNQINIFREESYRANAPLQFYMGLLMLAPILMKYGNDEQKKLLPRILSAEDIWCQGYSEPQAGSDLASLQTKAVLEGDKYIVNGTKIWTSFAHKSTKIFCLVRTAFDVKPQAGISFLLIDFVSPGITVKEIVSNDGEVEQCQVFFDDVEVPVANRVGEENQGWEMAKYLLEFERGMFSYYPTIKKHIRNIDALSQEKRDFYGNRYATSPAYRAELSELEIDTLALEYMEHRIKASLSRGGNPGALSSLTKLTGTELSQRVDELALEIHGTYIAPFQNHVLQPDYIGETIGSELGVAIMNYYLNNRASTIYGGAAQVQRNIIAKMVLGL